ncbi:uncharacterized protein [Salvelinus alpinus]|uniref:uncharacterized protein n=1 Tax=Salvelinus alpinus TaxID=8036 RepID=UPI0039FBF4BB
MATISRFGGGLFVIHGAVDGYSRLVVFLKASDNNRSATVMESFEAAVTSYGVPSRVRCDRGGENNRICAFMEQFRGGERGSDLRGRSTHNQRIELQWRDVWHGVSNVYHDLFTFLETEQIIDINNEVDLWALHFVFLSRVNRDLAVFASQWNHHGLRTEQRQSPLQLFVSGSLAMQKANLTAPRDLFAPALTTVTSQATTSVPPTTTHTTTSAPLTSTTTSAPLTSTTTSAPLTSTTTSAPLTSTTTSAPLTSTTTSAPLTSTTTSAPLTSTTTSAPLTSTTTSAPPITTSTSAPPSTTSTSAPLTSTTSAPLTTTSTSAPLTTTTSAPLTSTSTSAPLTSTSTSAPPITTSTTTTSAPPIITSTSAPPTSTTSAPPTSTTSAPPTSTTSAPPTSTTSAPPTTSAAALYWSEGVIVPQIQFTISNTQMELLRTIIPMEGPRGSLGVDNLQRVMAVISSAPLVPTPT